MEKIYYNSIYYKQKTVILQNKYCRYILNNIKGDFTLGGISALR